VVVALLPSGFVPGHSEPGPTHGRTISGDSMVNFPLSQPRKLLFS
jgi:hypothetical protein